MSTTSAFFYGTLLHPKILKRVIGNDGSHLQICPALLLHADYPGVLPYEKSRQLLGDGISEDDKCVRGTLVAGLTPSDISFLDVFEGDEYTREPVLVHPLGALAPLSDPDDKTVAPSTPPPIPPLDALAPAVPAETYIWARPISELQPEIWSYETFMRENAWKWVGDGSVDNEDYLKIEERRAMNGNIARIAGAGEIIREESCTV
ncbi:hypothetical protein PUNSTDRAFT_64285 [Punctularia strigosozonata HHB-11173 SS5]|uniref:uncharacterized protein n=1 Tax=Punctularia strigosozonata (strain HHB-11173) TaxID=741275 RepID=UPI0004417871|nr:uncharacterized protein PUNSTDRAFT_64285 [Punctularia strigosozonata HHB-11173 SS5]EIN10901.1 hypothetical protein PUNSTDRAFT_64285 [Punctularia strigosozonata HHB-11173 SS5]